MANPRVHEVAKELGLTSKEVLAHLEKIGEAVKSHSSTVTEDVASRACERSSAPTEQRLRQPKAAPKKTTAAKAPAKAAPDG